MVDNIYGIDDDDWPDGVYGVGCEVADGSELVIVDELGVPLGQWLVWGCRVVHLHHHHYKEDGNDDDGWNETL